MGQTSAPGPPGGQSQEPKIAPPALIVEPFGQGRRNRRKSAEDTRDGPAPAPLEFPRLDDAGNGADGIQELLRYGAPLAKLHFHFAAVFQPCDKPDLPLPPPTGGQDLAQSGQGSLAIDNNRQTGGGPGGGAVQGLKLLH